MNRARASYRFSAAAYQPFSSLSRATENPRPRSTERTSSFRSVMMPETTRQIGLVESSSKVIETRLNVEMRRDDFLPPVFPQITEEDRK